jgi:N6-adenosine-specific RNA methylase IME4
MEAAHGLARGWGFEQKTILTWVKPRVGLGYYFRNNTEHVLFCVKGSLAPLTVPLRTAFNWAQGRHSEKPAGFYDLVESVSPGPYLDVFARTHRFNWDAFGNEVYSAVSL